METTPNTNEREAVDKSCSQCWKFPPLCVCQGIRPLKAKVRVLILQHPQEAREPLGTARLASLSIQDAVHCVGLSWSSLSKALGEPATPNEWAVLYVGTKSKSQPVIADKPFRILDRNENGVSVGKIKGLILLDGNWKQSKTLWWRNPWLTRVNRLILNPSTESLYEGLRRQPRSYCLSSLESMALAMECLGESPKIKENLLRVMKNFVAALQQVP